MDKKPDLPDNKIFEPIDEIRDIFEYAIECISRIDKQGNYLSVNKNYADVFGFHRDEIIGLSWFDTIHRDDIEKARCAYQAMLEKGMADIEIRGIRKDGTSFYQHVLLVKGINEKSSLLGHYCFMQDITERKLSEQNLINMALEEATHKEALFSALVDAFNIRQGDNFFNDLASQIQNMLNCDYVVMGEIVKEDPYQIKSLVVCHKGKFLGEISYSLKGSPCEKTITKMINSCENNVQAEYPEFNLLKQLDAESYIGAPLFDPDNGPIGIIAVINKTPIKNVNTYESLINLFAIRAADELVRKQSQEQLGIFKGMINASNDFISMVDLDYKYVSVNDTYQRFFDKTKDEIINHAVVELHGEKDFNNFIKPALDKCFKGEFVKNKIIKVNKEGDEVHIGAIYNPYYSDKGKVIGAVIFAHDMTDYVITERELDKSLDYIAKVIRLSPDIICVTNLEDGEIVDINESFCNVTGWSHEEAIGKTTTELNIYPPEIRKKYVDMIINNGELNGEELTFYKKNGEMAYVLASSFFINLYGKNQILTIARDITERKHAEILLELETKCYKIESSTYDFRETLIKIIKEVESYFDSLIGSINLFDAESKYIVNSISPGLPQSYLDSINGEAIGEGAGSCGTAAHREELVIVSDIENDELWKDYRELANTYGLKACWSIPIISSRNQVLGTFAGYYKRIQTPSSFELMMLYRVARIVGNIVEQKQHDQILKESREKFRTLYDDTPSMFFSLDEEGNIVSVNQFGARSLGYEIKELLGKSVLCIIHESDKQKATEKVKECFENPGVMYRWEVRKRHRDGHVIWVRETAHVLVTNNKREVFIVCEDISENYRLSQQLEYQAKHDALTNLVNRREFENRLGRVLTEKSFNIPGHALCYLDLDNFKVINDNCGHLAGDAMLKQLSELLSASLRSKDTLARLGGDEFGILMEHCSLDKAIKIAEKILSIVEEYRFIWNENKFAIGVSIGLVPLDETSGSVNDVLSAADNACYIAKESGRNRIHVYSPDDTELERRRGEMQWVARINEALEENLFCLFYQNVVPISSSRKKSKKRFELLVRIKTHDDSYILPGAFLPAAERYNLSNKVDQWVIDTALNWLASRSSILKSVESCAINISGHSLSNENFLDMYIEKISRSKVPANKLCFEITETAAIANLGNARIL